MSWLQLAGGVLAVMTATSTAEPPIETTADEAAAPSEVLILQDDRYLRMTVPVTINGQGPFDFMIDTGAQATVLSHALADSLQLNERSMATLVAMASSRAIETTTVPHMQYGNHARMDALAALVDGPHIGGADGILGLDSLQDRRVLLDFENLQMEVVDTGTRAEERSYDIIVRARRRGDQLIITRARLDGVDTTVVVDTGAQGSIGNAELLRRLRRAHDGGEVLLTDVNGVEANSELRIARDLVLDRAQLSNFAIAFAPSPIFAALDLEDQPALILGMSELRAFKRVAIDFASRRVLFDLPESATLREPETIGRLRR